MRLLVTDTAAQSPRQATARLIMTFGKMKKPKAQFIVGSICIVLGLLWLGWTQVEISYRPTALVSNTADKIDFTRTDITGKESREYLYEFAHEVSERGPIVFLPMLPIALGFFLFGCAVGTLKKK